MIFPMSTGRRKLISSIEIQEGRMDCLKTPLRKSVAFMKACSNARRIRNPPKILLAVFCSCGWVRQVEGSLVAPSGVGRSCSSWELGRGNYSQ